MQAETLVSLPPGGTITDDAVLNGTLHLLLTSTSSLAHCPVCLTPTAAQHSSYQRRFRDVPCGGYPLRMQLRTRRFFCRQHNCARHIFYRTIPILPAAASADDLAVSSGVAGLKCDDCSRSGISIGVHASPANFRDDAGSATREELAT